MAVVTEGRYAGEFVVSESNGSRSRDVVTIAAGIGKLEPGTVLAKLTATGEFVPFDGVGSDGSQEAVAVFYGSAAAATAGAYQAVAIVRDAEVNGRELVWFDQATAAAGAAQLAAKSGIVVRN